MFRRRPGFYTALLFACGITAASRHADSAWWIVALPLFIAALSFLMNRRHRKTVLLSGIISAVFLISGYFRMALESPERYPPEHILNTGLIDSTVTVNGWIGKRTDTAFNTARFDIIVSSVSSGASLLSPVAGKIVAYLDHVDRNIGYGDEISVEGVLRLSAGKRNPGGYDRRAYLLREGIFAELRIIPSGFLSFRDAEHGNYLKRALLVPLQNFFERRFAVYHRSQELEFIRAIILGKRSKMEPGILEDFRDTGTLHILAVSGLHVGIVLLIFYFIFSMARIPKRWHYLLSCVGIILFMGLTGARPPVMRAGLFLILFNIGIIAQRYRDGLNLLGITALILLMYNPYELFDPGFQLSFCAVLGILYFNSELKPLILGNDSIARRKFRSRLLRNILMLLVLSGGAFFGTMPVMAYHFSRLSPASIVLSVLFVPAAGVIVGLGFTEIVTGILFPRIAEIFSVTNDMLINVIFWLNNKAAGLPWAGIWVGSREYIWVICAVFYLSVLMYLLSRKIRHRAVILTLLFGVFGVFSVWFAQPEAKLSVAFLDVGQGDAAVIRFPDGTNILIDGGESWQNGDAGTQHIIPYLRWAGIRNLQGVILSHPNRDHFGGLPSVLQAVRVDTLYESTFSDSLPGMRGLHEVMKIRGIGRRVLSAGSRIGSGDFWRAYVLSPDSVSQKAVDPENLNANSMVLMITYRGTKILFTGDIGFDEEERLLKYGSFLRSDLLKIPHHGSKYSSSSEFLDAVSPGFAVISAGRYNVHGHPAPETIRRLNDTDARILRTDLSGFIQIDVVDGKIMVNTMYRDR
ncbi:DNA internalization-related competence protein ComEC/Rec2 [candidate division KSB1 bacterium]